MRGGESSVPSPTLQLVAELVFEIRHIDDILEGVVQLQVILRKVWRWNWRSGRCTGSEQPSGRGESLSKMKSSK